MNMLRHALMPVGLVVVVLVAGTAAFCQPAANTPQSEADAMLDGLNQDIQLLYTLNRLDLQGAQITQLLGIMEQMSAEALKLEDKRQAALAQLIPLLREKRSLLLQDQTPTDELEGKIRDAQDRLDDLSNGMVEARGKFADTLRKVLSPAQVAIVTGADEANAQAEELLDWIRELPDAEYADEAKANANELADPDDGLPADAILKLFNEARKLSAADYAKSKAGIVAKLAKLYMPMPEAANDALITWFGNPRLRDVMKERLEKLGGK